MVLMQSRSIDYPENYDPSDVIMDVFFCSALMAIYDDIVVNSTASQRSIGDVLKEYEFNDQILNYVTGDHPPPFGVSWVGAERVFCVWNVENLHYCTLVFIINDATIEVYDCNKRANSIEKVDGLIKTHSDVVFNVAQKLRQVKHVEGLPQDKIGEAYGIYSLKFIEFIMVGQNMEGLRTNKIHAFREKFAIEIFHECLEPPII
ncbi:hypothetical protein RND71_015451 [Anisodus tanguticus]|uniref:Ubiquitin-like protease family profile domain-containing protein n=1 Tax=Anisodus tanguticus TaxID=243964 RepID=A0AAE1S5P2_9SOLA|nr:hypothetical protein RND71_015451 [Anisodus tanguticus]